jgi:hypothetical protein
MIRNLLFIIIMSMILSIISITEHQPTAYGGKDSEKYNKENCEEHNGEWIKDECDFYENQMKEGWEVDEQEFYEDVCQDDNSKKCEKHKESIEDGD